MQLLPNDKFQTINNDISGIIQINKVRLNPEKKGTNNPEKISNKPG